MLIRNILEESVRKFDEVKAVKWLKKKEIMERRPFLVETTFSISSP